MLQLLRFLVEDVAVTCEMSQQQNGDVQLQDGSNVEAVNGHSNDHFSKDSLQNAPVKGDRVIKKAKRPSKHVAGRKSSESGDDDAVGLVNGNARLPFSKNSRKSRGSKGRGNPKKGKRDCSHFTMN